MTHSVDAAGMLDEASLVSLTKREIVRTPSLFISYTQRILHASTSRWNEKSNDAQQATSARRVGCRLAMREIISRNVRFSSSVIENGLLKNRNKNAA
jgi:hypothetical protein